jgi:peptidoglycan/LPS O-acetylase OafA/YrhL
MVTRTSFQPHFHGLRGVAAVIVVFSHYVGAFYQAAHSGDARVAHLGWEVLFAETPLAISISGCFAVSIFFVLSGYVLTLPYMKTKGRDDVRLWSSLFKRPIRLLGIILFTMVLSYVLNRQGLYFNKYAAFLTGSGWFAVQPDPPASILQLLCDLVLSPFASSKGYSGPLWTMPFELYGGIGSFLFALVFAPFRFRWVGYVLAFYLTRDQFYCGFVFGIFFADVYNNFSSWLSTWNKAWCLVPAIPASIYFSGYPIYANKSLTPHSWYALLPDFPYLGGSYCMVGAVLVFALVLVNPALHAFFGQPLFVYLGRIAFALYAVHFLVLRSFSAWLFVALSHSMNYHLDALLTFLAGLLVIFPLAHGMSVLIDEPSIRFADFFAKRFALCWKQAGPAAPVANATVPSKGSR